MKNKLKLALVGQEFKLEDYSDGLNNLLKEFGIEANTWDFDFDRLYNAGYEEKEDWDAEYIGSLDIELITKGDEENEEEFIKIIDVFGDIEKYDF